jgi:class 3 adenylate cyclase
VHLRQEFVAPAAAILGYTDILFEDAARLGIADAVADLERIRSAGTALNRLLETVLADSGEAAGLDPTELRHDLRTPLNAIKGYGEMLLEDAAESEASPLVSDLERLLEAVKGMLARIEALIGFTGQPSEGKPLDGAAISIQASAVETLRTIGPPAAIAVQADLCGRILVVDDNAANRDLLERQLTREGHDVAQVSHGLAALEYLQRKPVDLILLDLMMPEISGYEVLTRLKAQSQTRDIPVIMISALDEIESIVRCIEAGAVDYLPKPFDRTLLRARIRSTLENKALRDRELDILRQIKEEKERSETLLLSILPSSIVTRINSGATMISDHIAEATILFADIVNFTPLASRLPATELISFLDSIFTAFDRLAEYFGAEKIKTIGDAYMAAFGLPQPRPDHAPAAARMGHAMIAEVGRIAAESGREVTVRIGMHSGPAVAGVIGRKKFSYDVWGQTVNIASRLESHGEPGRINVSQAFAERIRGMFELEDRGDIEIKGSGKLRAFFLGPSIDF